MYPKEIVTMMMRGVTLEEPERMVFHSPKAEEKDVRLKVLYARMVKACS